MRKIQQHRVFAPHEIVAWRRPRGMRRETVRDRGERIDATEVYLAWLVAGLAVSSLFLAH